MNIKLARISYLEDATLGVLLIEGKPACMTLELPWKGNKKQISCIPIGKYICERVKSPKFGNTFEIKDVPNRSEILFHHGNTKDDSSGCILLGSEFGELDQKNAVLNSKNALRKFFRLTQDVNEFNLEITD